MHEPAEQEQPQEQVEQEVYQCGERTALAELAESRQEKRADGSDNVARTSSCGSVCTHEFPFDQRSVVRGAIEIPGQILRN